MFSSSASLYKYIIVGIMQSISISTGVFAIANIVSFSLGSIFLKKAYDGIQAKKSH